MASLMKVKRAFDSGGVMNESSGSVAGIDVEKSVFVFAKRSRGRRLQGEDDT